MTALDNPGTVKLTTDTITINGLPAWMVSGPYGTVTYQLDGNILSVYAAGADPQTFTDRYADECRDVADARNDKHMFVVLTSHYHLLADGIHGLPAGLSEWAQLTGDELTAAMMQATWYAWPEDVAGRWAILPINVPPHSGAPIVASAFTEQIARSITADHNNRLDADRRAERGRQAAQQLADQRTARIKPVKDVIRPGDIVFVPRGVDPLYQINYRFCASTIDGRGAYGLRVKPDGTLIKGTGYQSSKDGGLAASAKWDQLLQCTIYRDGKPIYEPTQQQSTKDGHA